MSGTRVATGGLIDRTKPLHFRFDGRPYQGFEGDTLASALLANGVRIVGRGFKYHRPRGIWGAWVDEPNAIFDVTLNGVRHPNVNAATTPLEAGMDARTVNAWPNARFDLKGVLDLAHPLLGAGFYYKTFIWPDWHLFEPMIRRMAGLGHLSGEVPDDFTADQSHATCDLLMIGGGAAGLVAARRAAETGQDVVLVEDHPVLGGSLHSWGALVEGQTPLDWIAAQRAALEAAGARIMTRTTAFGLYDHRIAALSTAQRLGNAPTLTRMRARQIVLATGALDRPVTFTDNDRPGVMSLLGALDYLGRYGVRVGREITVLANHTLTDPAMERLEQAGATLRRLDPAETHAEAIGRRGVSAVSYGTARHHCDTLLASGGLVPLVHLWRHAGGELVWDDARAAFLPGRAPDGLRAIGAANGTFDLDDALAEARGETPRETPYHMVPVWPKKRPSGRQWIDLQHDVTLKDIEIASQEGFASVEHLKRYTTLGMAVDQGKTSNMAGLAALAALQDKPIPEVGTTTFRPPFTPQPLALYKPPERGTLYRPLKRLPVEQAHRDAGAALGEYGGWLRPGWYGSGDPEARAQAEARMARSTVGLFDGSPLGKIEVMGPDAEPFVNFIYYNTIATLRPGKLRYGFMLTESGAIYDDGVIARLAADHFVISCSSSHVDGVYAMLETWRQDGHDPSRVFVHDATQSWATLAISGPKARATLAALDLGIDLSAAAFPHMSLQDARFSSTRARIARVSFTGDVSFEVSVPVAEAHALWRAVCAAAEPLGGAPIGVEALSILRAEKGYIMVGKDTDGETMPHDLGVTAPRLRKTARFVGDRALHSPEACREDRQQLVGVRSAEGDAFLPVGAHLVDGTPPKSIGFVTSSYHSPTLNRPIALALMRGGRARIGQRARLWHMGETTEATVTDPTAFDPAGERLHAE